MKLERERRRERKSTHRTNSRTPDLIYGEP